MAPPSFIPKPKTWSQIKLGHVETDIPHYIIGTKGPDCKEHLVLPPGEVGLEKPSLAAGRNFHQADSVKTRNNLDQWVPKCGPQTSRISITWEFIRDADS